MDFAALLAPFLNGEPLTKAQAAQVQSYLDLLLRWNRRVNLTAVREPHSIVTRHFGESFFAGRELLRRSAGLHLTDIGSGAGFPGLAIKIYSPSTSVSLIEAQGKKATFLREVIRSLALTDVDVITARAESLEFSADVVTLRAVERFEEILPIAAEMVKRGGRIGLLISTKQIGRAKELLPEFSWFEPLAVPLSEERVLLTGVKPSGKESVQ